MSDNIRVRLTGKAMCEFTRYITIPRSELGDLGDEGNIQCNLYPDESIVEVIEWEETQCIVVG